ncbi:MAG: hypothetical protein LBL07_18660 [Tannerella sp.]|jgi:hypothetical protein|nr:hypothetical protein [Tannerella sp.]
MKVKVADRQTFYDLAILYTGLPENAVAIAVANTRGVVDELRAGEEIAIPEGLPAKKAVVDYYAARQLNPATEPEKNKLNLSTAHIWINAAGEAKTITILSNTSWIILN